MRSLLFVLLAAVGCKGFDPVGAYVGTVKETARAQIEKMFSGAS